MNKILFIGASGFDGIRLIDICKNEFDIINFDKQQNSFFQELTTIGDVKNPDDLKIAMQGKETVVLLAAEHRDDVSPVSLYYEVNVQGTQNVLEAMDKANLKNIVFTSSVAIYGLNKQNPDE